MAELKTKATKVEPKMWGTSIVGFGTYHYRYASGREWMLTSFHRVNKISRYTSCPVSMDTTLY